MIIVPQFMTNVSSYSLDSTIFGVLQIPICFFGLSQLLCTNIPHSQLSWSVYFSFSLFDGMLDNEGHIEKMFRKWEYWDAWI